MEFGSRLSESHGKWSDNHLVNHLVVCWPHHVVKNNLCCHLFFLGIVRRKAARAARVRWFRAQQRVSSYNNQSNYFFVRPRHTTTPFHRHVCRSSNALNMFNVCAHTWAESRKTVRNRISIYISVESIWNRFKPPTSRGGFS